MSNDVFFNVKIDADLKKQFQEACEENFTDMSKAIRHFMFDYVKSTNEEKQTA